MATKITSKRCRIFQNLKGQWISRRSFSYIVNDMPNSTGFDTMYAADQQDIATADSYKWLSHK